MFFYKKLLFLQKILEKSFDMPQKPLKKLIKLNIMKKRLLTGFLDNYGQDNFSLDNVLLLTIDAKTPPRLMGALRA